MYMLGYPGIKSSACVVSIHFRSKHEPFKPGLNSFVIQPRVPDPVYPCNALICRAGDENPVYVIVLIFIVYDYIYIYICVYIDIYIYIYTYIDIYIHIQYIDALQTPTVLAPVSIYVHIYIFIYTDIT